ncbi:MAG TPA: hypothetical protein VHI14_10075, partial [Jatrophihabitantaceae bacterium]|nr:hypothetical protein [Jatrophihabitantaceae bacterium]
SDRRPCRPVVKVAPRVQLDAIAWAIVEPQRITSVLAVVRGAGILRILFGLADVRAERVTMATGSSPQRKKTTATRSPATGTRGSRAAKTTSRAASRPTAPKAAGMSTSAAKSSPTTNRSGAQKPATATPPAASVAAAQAVLDSVERREVNVRAALRADKKDFKKLKKRAKRHRVTLKDLKSDLDKITSSRVAIVDNS